MTAASEWRRVDAALDEILSLPSVKWQEACERIAGDDTALLRELESLLANIEGEDPVLDHPAAGRATGSRITGALPGGRHPDRRLPCDPIAGPRRHG